MVADPVVEKERRGERHRSKQKGESETQWSRGGGLRCAFSSSLSFFAAVEVSSVAILRRHAAVSSPSTTGCFRWSRQRSGEPSGLCSRSATQWRDAEFLQEMLKLDFKTDGGGVGFAILGIMGLLLECGHDNGGFSVEIAAATASP
ncbi:hypothetical protein PIB30_081495 [Stylosanthes scabra]|uniref:Uncharacterized protein n=1 Tax=Stylosanthes scabra TaxID=79078 RepID=A0ABU6XUB0_9FABA|nr:hypothetical protein [Stylosanthes scabra]